MRRETPNPDAGFHARFDRERAKVLRRRIVVYCVLAVAAFALSFRGNFNDWAAARGQGKPVTPLMVLNFSWDGAIFALYAASIVFLFATRPDRRRLVGLVTVLTVIAVGASAPLEGLTNLLERPDASMERAARIGAGWMSVLSGSFLAVLALVLVPMRWVEALRVAVPCWAITSLAILTVAQSPVLMGVGQALAAGAAVAAGVAWSTWRHREFDERFRSREVAAQLGDLSAELAYARRIHEALFPPPLTEGPVRITYWYEPMRAIGGDFLFVWPLAFPPSQSVGPVHAVILDVSGHGVSAALTVNRLHDELRRFFAAHPEGGAGALIEHLNGFVSEQLAVHGVFATALAMTLDPESGRLDWASAGHPPAFIRKGGPGGSMERLVATAPMLGVLEAGLFAAAAGRATLGSEDVVFAFTDGAFEGLDPTGHSSGLEQLLGVLEGATDAPEAAARVASVRGGPATDDVLIVELRRRGR